MSRDRVFRFGAFEVCPTRGELRRRGLRVHLPAKALALLAALVERPGQVVTRDELRRLLWPDTHVDFERGLNNAASRVRHALADSAHSPRFVETVRGVGYRFLGPVATEWHARSVSRSGFGGRAAAAVLAVLIAVASVRIEPRSAVLDSPGRTSYLAGLHQFDRQRPDSLLEARQSFEQAIRVDPGLAPAHVGLTLVCLDLADWRLAPRAELEAAARGAAARALRLDPGLADAHVATAHVRARLDGDWTGAGRALDAALRVDPGSAAAWRFRADWLAARGLLSEAIAAIDRASSAQPLSVAIHLRAGRLRYYARRHEEAIERLRLALAMDPANPGAHRYLSDAYWQAGLPSRAEHELQAWLAALGIGAEERERVRRALAAGGMKQLWRDNARRAEGGARGGPGVALKVAGFYAALGEAPGALSWLALALSERDPALVYLNVDPAFDRVRREPRFQALLGSVASAFGLPRGAAAPAGVRVST